MLRVLSPRPTRRDPLRPLRLARLAAELGFAPDADDRAAHARRGAGASASASAERIFGELRKLVVAPGALAGRASWPTGSASCAPCCPSSTDLHDVDQSRYHHLDVYGHTWRCSPARSSSRAGSRRCSASTPPALERSAARAARGRSRPRPGDPLRRAAARRGQAGHARRAPRRPRDLHRPRRASASGWCATSAAACARASASAASSRGSPAPTSCSASSSTSARSTGARSTAT